MEIILNDPQTKGCSNSFRDRFIFLLDNFPIIAHVSLFGPTQCLGLTLLIWATTHVFRFYKNDNLLIFQGTRDSIGVSKAAN